MTLALALALPQEDGSPTRLRVVPAPPCAPPYDDEPGGVPHLRLVAVPEEPFVPDDTPWFSEDRTPLAELPDPAVVTGRLVQALVEVLAGARPLRHLRRELSIALYAEIAESLQDGHRSGGGRPAPRVVLSVHTQTWGEGLAEACATVRHHGRLRAVALRLEGFNGRWICTDLEGL